MKKVCPVSRFSSLLVLINAEKSVESLEVCNKLTQLPRASKPSVIFQRGCPCSGPAIVSAAFVTDGVWPTGLQLAHLVALKPLGARRKHMGRISWRQHLRVLERACSIAPARRAWKTSTINLFNFFTFFFALKLTSMVSVWRREKHLHHWTRVRSKLYSERLMITSQDFCHQWRCLGGKPLIVVVRAASGQ